MRPEGPSGSAVQRPRRPPRMSSGFSDSLSNGVSAAVEADVDDAIMAYAGDEQEEIDDLDDIQSWCDNHIHQTKPSYQDHSQNMLHTQPTHQQSSVEPYGSNAYMSDDVDMSDDGGVPLLDYSNLTSLLANDFDIHGSLEAGMPYAFSDHDDDYDDDDDEYDNETDEDDHEHHPILNENHDVAHASEHTGEHVPFAVASQAVELTWSFSNIAADPPASHDLQETLAADTDLATAWFNAHPELLSNPNPNTLGARNYNLTDFLHQWAGQGRDLQGLPRERGRFPWVSKIAEQARDNISHIQYADLEGDRCDFQGIDWEDLGVRRREARERRMLTHENYVNKPDSDRWHPNLPDVVLPRTDSFFRFRRMDIRRNVHLAHFQLRNLLACASRTQVFYAGMGVVHKFNPITGQSKVAMKLNDSPNAHLTVLASGLGLLIAGGFNGEYILRNLNSDADDGTECREGTITSHPMGITNHVQIHQARQSSSTRVAFASNDLGFRVMDVETETVLSHENYEFPLNCSALSPDRRLRVMVGDHCHVLIAAAESSHGDGRPEILQELAGHRDHGFACDWADDGWTVATGAQDKAVKVWDARRWTDASGKPTPMCTLRAEMAGVRSLRFSPAGSGKRVLVAAEEADFVSIVDAQTFRSKQTIDVFGEIGGVDFANAGQDLAVLCCDATRGGVLVLERAGRGAEAAWDGQEEHLSPRELWWRRGRCFDWPRSRFTEQRRIKESDSRRRRKGAFLDDMEPF